MIHSTVMKLEYYLRYVHYNQLPYYTSNCKSFDVIFFSFALTSAPRLRRRIRSRSRRRPRPDLGGGGAAAKKQRGDHVESACRLQTCRRHSNDAITTYVRHSKTTKQGTTKQENDSRRCSDSRYNDYVATTLHSFPITP